MLYFPKYGIYAGVKQLKSVTRVIRNGANVMTVSARLASTEARPPVRAN